jgi:tellurite resistance protein
LAEEIMKVHERIDVLTDLFLGALYADQRFDRAERQALRELLCELTLQKQLPVEVECRITRFTPERFDLVAAAREFRRDPPMRPRRLLELVSQLCLANGELDFEEDEYLHRLARALELEPVEYEDIVLDYEVLELESMSA